jgi:hypothetical protein
MNRRNFVHAMTGAALFTPFGLRASGTPFLPPAPGLLQIYLDGPFALVLKKDKGGKIQEITAFAPVEAQRSHLFHFHGDHDKRKDYILAIEKDGLILSTSISSISSQFAPFTGNASAAPKLESFITVKLPPSPEQILFFSSAQVTIEGLADPVEMPLDHVLVYRVADINKVKMSCDQFPASAPIKIGSNSGQFHIQVGLPPGSDPNGNLAVQFFNQRLLVDFPDSGVKKLKQIVSMHVETNDVECKNGGLLLTQS